jgi:hypothetical protein
MSQVVITRGPLDGEKLSKTITDATAKLASHVSELWNSA